MAGHDLLLESTLSRELHDLASSHRSMWLADALPSGPTVVWAGSRALATTLCADPARPVVLIDPDEASAADAMRRAPFGLRVVHEPDPGRALLALEALGMARFRNVVVVTRDAGELRLVLPALVSASDPQGGIGVIAPTALVKIAVEVLGPDGGPVRVHHQHLAAASRIDGHAPRQASRLLELGHPLEGETVVLSRGLAAQADSVLLGPALTGARSTAEADQVAASTTELESAVTRRHRAELRELEMALSAARADTARAEAAIADRELRLEQVHQSHSWRVTAPLRRLTDLVRRR